MAGYQFMHMECYAKTSRKGSGNSGKTGDGRTADEVIAEAIREAGNAPHVKNPRKPHIADTCRAGYGFKDLKADYEAACDAKVTMANGKTRKNRSTALTLATMVCTYPVPVSELKTPEQKRDYQRWRKRAIQYARSEFGDDLQVLGVFAEFETNLRRERQMEGIAQAKAKGVYKGRPADGERIATIFNLKKQGIGATEIARRVGVTRPYVYKVLARQSEMFSSR